MLTRNEITKYNTTYGDNPQERILRRQKFKDACRRIRAELEKEKLKKSKEYRIAIGKEYCRLVRNLPERSLRKPRENIAEKLAKKYEVSKAAIKNYARMYKKNEAQNDIT